MLYIKFNNNFGCFEIPLDIPFELIIKGLNESFGNLVAAALVNIASEKFQIKLSTIRDYCFYFISAYRLDKSYETLTSDQKNQLRQLCATAGNDPITKDIIEVLVNAIKEEQIIAENEIDNNNANKEPTTFDYMYDLLKALNLLSAKAFSEAVDIINSSQKATNSSEKTVQSVANITDGKHSSDESATHDTLKRKRTSEEDNSEINSSLDSINGPFRYRQ